MSRRAMAPSVPAATVSRSRSSSSMHLRERAQCMRQEAESMLHRRCCSARTFLRAQLQGFTLIPWLPATPVVLSHRPHRRGLQGRGRQGQPDLVGAANRGIRRHNERLASCCFRHKLRLIMPLLPPTPDPAAAAPPAAGCGGRPAAARPGPVWAPPASRSARACLGTGERWDNWLARHVLG